MSNCYKCNATITDIAYITRSDICKKCGFNLRCCMNCEFYDSGSYNECTESQAERVTDKEKSNFCDYFRFRGASGGDTSRFSSSKKKANPLDALFKK